MQTNPVLLIGAGGHAKVLLDAMLMQRISVLAIVDKHPGGGWTRPAIISRF